MLHVDKHFHWHGSSGLYDILPLLREPAFQSFQKGIVAVGGPKGINQNIFAVDPKDVGVDTMTFGKGANKVLSSVVHYRACQPYPFVNPVWTKDRQCHFRCAT